MAIFKKRKVKTELEERLGTCSQDTLKQLVWLCVVRCLPFLEAKETFDFWPVEERQKCLASMLLSVDIIAQNTYGSTVDIADFVANNAYGAAVAIEGYSCDVTIYNTMTNIAEVVSYVRSGNKDDAHQVILRAAHGLHINMESIILQDLDCIIMRKQIPHFDMSIYEESWDNFQTALPFRYAWGVCIIVIAMV